MKPEKPNEYLVRFVSNAGEGEPIGNGELVIGRYGHEHAAQHAALSIAQQFEGDDFNASYFDGADVHVEVENLQGVKKRFHLRGQVKLEWLTIETTNVPTV